MNPMNDMSISADNGRERRRLASREPVREIGDFEVDVRGILLFFYRRRKIIIGSVLIGFFVAFFYSLVQPKEYVAKAVMQLNTNTTKIVDIRDITMNSSQSAEMAKQTEIDILLSREVAGRVVDALDLYSNPTFNKALNKSLTTYAVEWVKSLFVEPKVYTDEELAEKKRLLKISLISKLQSSVVVDNHPRSKTVDILVRSTSAKDAALIANTYADEFMAYQMDMKFDVSKRANEWISQRLEDLRQNVHDSEVAVQQHRDAYGLYESKGVLLNESQVSELNSQLILAQAKRAESESKLKAIKKLIRSGANPESATDVLKSSIVNSLRYKMTELSSKKSELATRYGPKHPKMINLNAEMKDIQNSISKEIEKIVSSLEGDVEIAKSREQALSSSLQAAQGGVGSQSSASIKLGELIREAAANQKLYESFLARFKELAQTQNVVEADSRFIARAETPYKPTYPRTKLILLIGLFLGGIMGVLIAMLIEKLDVGFCSLENFEKVSAYVGLGLVPCLKNEEDCITYAIRRLHSEFSESLRAVMVGIHYSNTLNPPKVIMVTSSVTGEGKSLLTLSMARLAAQSGKKVLLIDADMRRPSQAHYLEISHKHTLHDYLEGGQSLDKVKYQDKLSGMDVILSDHDTQYSQELLSTERMHKLIEQSKKGYDFVFIDTPPIAAVADALVMATMVDTTLFVCQWNKTPRPVVLSVLKKLRDCKVRVAGLVLNNVDMEKGSEYGYGDCFKEYKEYYKS